MYWVLRTLSLTWLCMEYWCSMGRTWMLLTLLGKLPCIGQLFGAQFKWQSYCSRMGLVWNMPISMGIGCAAVTQYCLDFSLQLYSFYFYWRQNAHQFLQVFPFDILECLLTLLCRVLQPLILCSSILQTTHVAAQYGQTALLYHIVTKWGAEVDSLDHDGRSPLHWLVSVLFCLV